MSEMDTTNKPENKIEFREPTKEEIFAAKTLVVNATCSLLYSHPLSFHIMSQCNFKCMPGLGTFGVAVKGTGIMLYYDPLFALKMHNENPKKLENILRHESLHLVFSHLTLGFPKEALNDYIYKQLFNIALDFKVNEQIPDIWQNDGQGQAYDGVCGAAALKKMLNLDSCEDKNSLDLYALLKKKADEDPNFAKQFMPKLIDQHGNIVDESDLTDEQKKSIIGRNLRAASDRMTERQRGELPSAIKRALDDAINSKHNKHKWDSLLKQFLCSVKQPKQVATWKRPSRRYGFKATGHKKDIKPSIAICLDTSGSMGDEALIQTLGVVKALAFRFSDIWFLAGDTRVDYCELLKRCDVNTKLLQFKSGGGGTILQPLLDKAEEKRVNATILISDGYCERLQPNNKTVGLIVPGGTNIPGLDTCFNFEEFT